MVKSRWTHWRHKSLYVGCPKLLMLINYILMVSSEIPLVCLIIHVHVRHVQYFATSGHDVCIHTVYNNMYIHTLSLQIIKGKRYTFSVDWWSYGVLCYEMITGQVRSFITHASTCHIDIQTHNMSHVHRHTNTVSCHQL